MNFKRTNMMVTGLVLPLLASASWTVNNATTPTSLTNADGGWNLTVKKENNALTITKYVAGSGDLDLTSCETDTGWKVAKVGIDVFGGNTNVRSFTGPDVTYLDARAFGSLTKDTSVLTNIVLSPSLSYMGGAAFYACKQLKTFSPTTLPNLTSAGDNVFYNCIALTGDFKLTAMQSVPASFFRQTKITSLEMPSATSIGSSVCNASTVASALTNVVFSPTLASIGSNAFYGCKKLKTVFPTTLPSLTSAGECAFYNCNALTGDFKLPSLRSMPKQCFYQTQITSLEMPSATSIGASACYAGTVASALTNVVFSPALASIGANAFYGCKKLKTVSPTTLPSLTSAGEYAFYTCIALTGNLAMPRLATLQKASFSYARLTSLDIRSATSIGASACSENSTLTNVITSATSFGEKAFYNCKSGAQFWWHGRTAPTLGKNAIDPSGTDKKARIFVHNARDREGWEAICSRTTPTAADKARADFPGTKRLIGVIAANNNDAWVLREGEPGTVVSLR